jgi:hypothetical protein
MLKNRNQKDSLNLSALKLMLIHENAISETGYDPEFRRLIPVFYGLMQQDHWMEEIPAFISFRLAGGMVPDPVRDGDINGTEVRVFSIPSKFNLPSSACLP